MADQLKARAFRPFPRRDAFREVLGISKPLVFSEVFESFKAEAPGIKRRVKKLNGQNLLGLAEAMLDCGA